jgi:hypothetical protein
MSSNAFIKMQATKLSSSPERTKVWKPAFFYSQYRDPYTDSQFGSSSEAEFLMKFSLPNDPLNQWDSEKIFMYDGST